MFSFLSYACEVGTYNKWKLTVVWFICFHYDEAHWSSTHSVPECMSDVMVVHEPLMYNSVYRHKRWKHSLSYKYIVEYTHMCDNNISKSGFKFN